MHRSLVKHLAPAVVLVEEAAEILEPQVLASLNSELQHLILLGDHHQLRPQVESYDLERWYVSPSPLPFRQWHGMAWVIILHASCTLIRLPIKEISLIV